MVLDLETRLIWSNLDSIADGQRIKAYGLFLDYYINSAFEGVLLKHR